MQLPLTPSRRQFNRGGRRQPDSYSFVAGTDVCAEGWPLGWHVLSPATKEYKYGIPARGSCLVLRVSKVLAA
ncbi:hypothetical protein BDA96_03G227700 [Sorghum bicolor]|uniref:Uncharacterized protein n=1 Tax=Sorghum bicolor TaxID=4558 RepID=A0A921UNJ9_SORBI|nr:hypothetical protein BDA96_03G227700 [Sorghum bicolor]